MAGWPLLKLGGLLIRTIAKPVASRMKVEARKHPRLMKVCLTVGEYSHQFTSRLNVLASGYKVLSVKPLPEDEALVRGVNFLSESFIFTVGATIITVEYVKSEAKSALKAEKEAEREAQFVARVTAIEEKLAQLGDLDVADVDNKFYDLDRRLKGIENVASYWALKEVNLGHTVAKSEPSAPEVEQIVIPPLLDTAVTYAKVPPEADGGVDKSSMEPIIPPRAESKAWLDWFGLSTWWPAAAATPSGESEPPAAAEPST